MVIVKLFNKVNENSKKERKNVYISLYMLYDTKNKKT